MATAPGLVHKPTAGLNARRWRVEALLNRQALAELAAVPLDHVSLFEHDFPVPLDSRRRILRVLWAMKAKK